MKLPQINPRWVMEQHPQEIEAFAEWLRPRFQQGHSVVEIGVRHGGTSALWHELLAASVVVGIDRIGHDSYREPEFSQRAVDMMAEFPRYSFVRGNSQDESTLQKVRGLITPPVGFLFIDGDHSYQGVRRDFDLWTQLMAPGGIVAFHDIVDGPRTGGGVHRFWNELHYDQKVTFLTDPPADWGGIGAVVLP